MSSGSMSWTSIAAPSDSSPPPPAFPPLGCTFSAKRITKKPISSMTMSAKEISHSGAPGLLLLLVASTAVTADVPA